MKDFNILSARDPDLIARTSVRILSSQGRRPWQESEIVEPATAYFCRVASAWNHFQRAQKREREATLEFNTEYLRNDDREALIENIENLGFEPTIEQYKIILKGADNIKAFNKALNSPAMIGYLEFNEIISELTVKQNRNWEAGQIQGELIGSVKERKPYVSVFPSDKDGADAVKILELSLEGMSDIEQSNLKYALEKRGTPIFQRENAKGDACFFVADNKDISIIEKMTAKLRRDAASYTPTETLSL